MKINSIQPTFGVKTNVNKNNPNFGVRLKASTAVQSLVQKELMNLSLRNPRNSGAVIAAVFVGFMNNINKFAGAIRDIEQEDLEVRMDVSRNAIEYIQDLTIDSKLYTDKYNDKPLLLGVKKPNSDSEYIVSAHQIPLSVNDFHKMKFDVMKLVNVYNDMTNK